MTHNEVREWFLVSGAAHHCRLNPSDIHVIEKSAYDALAQDNAIMRVALGLDATATEVLSLANENLRKDLAEARAKLEARDADETAAYMIGYSKSQDEARAEIERLNIALNDQIAFARTELDRITNYEAIQSRDALIERCKEALQFYADMVPASTKQGLYEPRGGHENIPAGTLAADMLTEIASFKKGEK